MTTNELINLFFFELKHYNSSNFKTLERANLAQGDDDPIVRKAFASVITRFNIFCEKHPELDKVSTRIIYYKLGIDKIGQYFSEFPDATVEKFMSFQVELKNYVKAHKEEHEEADEVEVTA